MTCHSIHPPRSAPEADYSVHTVYCAGKVTGTSSLHSLITVTKLGSALIIICSYILPVLPLIFRRHELPDPIK